MTDQSEFPLEVDGERFVVRHSASAGGGFDFDWVSGPNPGYGFTSGGLLGDVLESPTAPAGADPGASHERLVEQARIFLSMIDPATGFVADP